MVKLIPPIFGFVALAASRLNKPFPILLTSSSVSLGIRKYSSVHIVCVGLLQHQIDHYRYSSGCAHLVGLSTFFLINYRLSFKLVLYP